MVGQTTGYVIQEKYQGRWTSLDSALVGLAIVEKRYKNLRRLYPRSAFRVILRTITEEQVDMSEVSK